MATMAKPGEIRQPKQRVPESFFIVKNGLGIKGDFA
jgi:hypothetical protein